MRTTAKTTIALRAAARSIATFATFAPPCPFSKSSLLTDLKPLQELGSLYPQVGVLSYQGKQHASGVYFQDRLVLTAAHTVPSNCNLAAFLFSLDHGKKWNSIKRIIRHHSYAYYFPNYKYDIAVMQLEKDPKENLDDLKINYQKSQTVAGVGVGYPISYAPRLEIASALTMPTPFIRLGVKASCYPSLDGLFEHKIGYSAKMVDGKIQHLLQSYDILDSGIAKGMSGGGLFVNNRLAGVIVASQPRNGFSASIGDKNLYVPLHDKRSWLEDCISTFKSNASDLEDITALLKKLLDAECFDVLTKSELQLTFSLPSDLSESLAKYIEKLTATGFNIQIVNKGHKLFEDPRIAIVGDNLSQIKQKLEQSSTVHRGLVL